MDVGRPVRPAVYQRFAAERSDTDGYSEALVAAAASVTSPEGLTGRVGARLDALRGELLTLSHDVHAHPELGFEEHHAVAAVAALVRAQGSEGGGGSIGAHAVQIAKSMGAEVTAVDSRIKEPLVRRLGADHFIDYTAEDFTTSGRAYDVIMGMVPSGSCSARVNALRPNGRYFCGNPRLSVMMRAPFTTWFPDSTASCAFARETPDELRALAEMIEDGRIGSIVDRVFPMNQVAEAHRLVESEQRLGAVVIAMDSDGADGADLRTHTRTVRV